MEKFLIMNTSFFGDVLLTGALCRGIKIKYPDSKLIFMVNKPFYEAAKYLEGVDEVIEYDKKGENKGIRGFFSFYYKYKEVYKNEIRAAFVIYGNERGIILARLWGAKQIYSDNSSVFRFLLGCKNLKDEYNLHVQDKNLHLLSLYTGEKIDELPIMYYPPLEAEKAIDALLRKYALDNCSDCIAICTTSKRIEKDMPISICYSLIEKLSKDDYKVLLVGAGSDAVNYAQKLKMMKGKSFFNLVNQTSISELGALLKRCKYVISVDTGTLHLACAVRVPVIALFYINDVSHIRRWAPKNFYPHRLLVGSEISIKAILGQMKTL